MQYEFLQKWVEENRQRKLIFHSIQRYQDQYLIIFRKQKQALQICLENDCFCFFTEQKTLPFSEKKELNQFNLNLAKAKLQKIELSKEDRIIILHFEKTDIYNQKQNLKLILELIPRYQNIVLVEDKKIIDCLRKVSFAENTVRQVLPGAEYYPPPTTFQVIKTSVHFPLSLNENLKLEHQKDGEFQNMNSALEALYYRGILEKKIQNHKATQIKVIQKKITKKERKLSKLRNELKEASKEEIWKQQAELLIANFSALKPGLKSIRLINYYENGFPEIEIKLDDSKSPTQNVEYYFKKYRKARDGKKMLGQQIELTEAEISDLELKIKEIAEFNALPENRSETDKHKLSKQEKFKMLKVDENWEIYIGRTSKENDFLTTRMAKPHDWWFHTRVFRGTHVILRNLNKLELPDKLRLICCSLAAYYSKAKKSGNIPVDFTQIKYVRKPKGSVPGYVTYTNQKTIFVDPLSIRDAKKML